MMRVSRRMMKDVKWIKSVEEYEALKLTSRALVGYFSAPFSTAGKLYKSKFDDMAKTYPDNYTFFKCDVDVAPRIAYDMEVEDVPSIGVLPLGSKPDGTTYSKIDMVTVKAGETMDYDQVVPRGKAALDALVPALSAKDTTEGSRRPWRFDPNTGTTNAPWESDNAFNPATRF